MTQGADAPTLARLPIVQVDQARIEEHLDGVVRRTVEETLNAVASARQHPQQGEK